MKMKFRIIKDGWLSYRAEVACNSCNSRDWVTLDHFFTKHGAKQYCIYFAKYCNHESKENRGSKENIVEEFEL